MGVNKFLSLFVDVDPTTQQSAVQNTSPVINPVTKPEQIIQHQQQQSFNTMEVDSAKEQQYIEKLKTAMNPTNQSVKLFFESFAKLEKFIPDKKQRITAVLETTGVNITDIKSYYEDCDKILEREKQLFENALSKEISEMEQIDTTIINLQNQIKELEQRKIDLQERTSKSGNAFNKVYSLEKEKIKNNIINLS